jgi:hypothetical protein
MNTGLRVLFVVLILAAGSLRAQDAPAPMRTPIPAQKPGTVYLLNDAQREVHFSLSYNARNWSDYELRSQHACIIPVEEFGHREVVVRFNEKPGLERSFRLEANERYRFVYKTELKQWDLTRCR